MNYAIVKDGIVTNIIVADQTFADSIGALPDYPGCAIGEPYQPPHEYTEMELLQQNITELELDTIALGQDLTNYELITLGGGSNV